jgi:6-pyruvoyltetrahydropterin/6-carboxytetrahydropterin synthase
MVYVTRRAKFSASHCLSNPELTEEQNSTVFNKCSYIHGHNYTIEVTIGAQPNPKTGFVIDLKDLKKILHETITDQVDHRHLNDLEMFRGVITSVENVIVIFWQVMEARMKEILPEGKLHKIKLWETENNFAEYYGEPVEIPRYDFDESKILNKK